MLSAKEALPKASKLAESIADVQVKKIYFYLLDKLSSLHDEMKLIIGKAEVRVHFNDTLICRIVPYRGLLHLTIGERPGFEVRVRGVEDSMEAIEKILERFLHAVATNSLEGCTTASLLSDSTCLKE